MVLVRVLGSLLVVWALLVAGPRVPYELIFRAGVIIAGTTPQDQYLIPNRICLDSRISPRAEIFSKLPVRS